MGFADLYDKYKDEIKSHKPKEKPKEEGEEGEVGGPQPPGMTDDISAIKLYKYFNVSESDKSSDDVKSKLAKIYDYVKNKVGGEEVSVNNYLHEIEENMGDPPLGVSRIDKVYQYIMGMKSAGKFLSRASRGAKNSNSKGRKNSGGVSGEDDKGVSPKRTGGTTIHISIKSD